MLVLETGFAVCGFVGLIMNLIIPDEQGDGEEDVVTGENAMPIDSTRPSLVDSEMPTKALELEEGKEYR